MLDSLLNLVREKRASEHSPPREKPRNSDPVETLRRLAELRSEGILTQEEFEDKKRQVLKSE